jgi:AbrB family looped-hinge helix DNA binding protein
MENVGVKKEIDRLGRICIPKEMRKLFNFENEVEIQITREGILIKNPEYVLVRRDSNKKEDSCE